jgi:hypothetical protein
MIKLGIEIESPLTPDDRDLLAGIAVMVLAIANREIAQRPDDEQPCGDMEYIGDAATGKVCVSEVGHKGRHKYRWVVEPINTEGMN